MKYVIDIPEGMLDELRTCKFPIQDAYRLCAVIENGTPLPKGHGRLIDSDALKLTQHDIYVESINYRHRCISVENIDEAPTIIEADKEGAEE